MHRTKLNVNKITHYLHRHVRRCRLHTTLHHVTYCSLSQLNVDSRDNGRIRSTTWRTTMPARCLLRDRITRRRRRFMAALITWLTRGLWLLRLRRQAVPPWRRPASTACSRRVLVASASTWLTEVVAISGASITKSVKSSVVSRCLNMFVKFLSKPFPGGNKCKCICKYILTCKTSWMNLMHWRRL